MKIARPTRNDLDAVSDLTALLEHLRDGKFPWHGSLSDDETAADPFQFDWKDPQHVAILQERLEGLFVRSPSGLIRIVYGMVALYDSGILDENEDTIALKSDIVAAYEQSRAT